jgi:hypothetical protein
LIHFIICNIFFQKDFVEAMMVCQAPGQSGRSASKALGTVVVSLVLSSLSPFLQVFFFALIQRKKLETPSAGTEMALKLVCPDAPEILESRRQRCSMLILMESPFGPTYSCWVFYPQAQRLVISESTTSRCEFATVLPLICEEGIHQ